LSIQTYTLDEFSTGAWSDRDEYVRDDIGWDHIVKLHSELREFKEFGKCGETDIWYFLSMTNSVSFDFYLYQVNTWSMEGENANAEPVMWIYGTTFDGVRESSGGEHFSCDLIELSDALRWLHNFSCDRWPRFKEWYQDK
jgi:hypothetical protein